MKNYNLCETSARYSRILLKIVPLAYASASCLYIVPSYIKFINSGTYSPSYNLYLPGLNENRLLDLAILEIYNLMAPVLATLTLIPFDVLIYIVLVNLTMASSIITGEINEFENILKNGNAAQCDINRRLIKIILMHKRYNE